MKTETLALRSLAGAELERVCARLRDGGVAVFPTDTVYGIGTAAGSASGLEKIYSLKGRSSDKPLPLLADSLESALPIAYFTPDAGAAAMKFWPGALTMVLSALPPGRAYCRGGGTLGLRVPALEELRALIKALGSPLAATSANLSGRPSARDGDSAHAQFNGLVDFIFTGGDAMPGDSTVMDFSRPELTVLREGSLPSAVVLSYLKASPK